MSIEFNPALLELLLSDGQNLNKFIPGPEQTKVMKVKTYAVRRPNPNVFCPFAFYCLSAISFM